MNCQECINQMKPEDPRQPFYIGGGRYLPPICEICPSYNFEPTESKPQVVEHIHRTFNISKEGFYLLQQTAGKLEHISEKLTKHLEYKKKPQPVKPGKGIKIE